MSSVMEIAMKEMGELIAAAKSPLSAIDALKAETATYGINVKYPPAPLVGAKGDGITDDTAALTAIRNYVASLTGAIPELIFPSGTYLYSVSPNWGIPNLKMVGLGNVILKCTGAGNAFILDASPDGVNRYYENISIENIIIVGHSLTPNGFYSRNIVRSTFKDIEVREVEKTSGVAFAINFAVSNSYINLIHTVERSTSMALDGIFLTNSLYGAPTNNTFINSIMEGCAIGIRVFVGDNNIFIGGTAESCTSYGIITSSNARSNTFIGVALEENGTADIGEAGKLNQYIGCYSQKDVLIQDAAINTVIQGGFYQKITIDAAAKNPVIENCYIAMNVVGGSIVINNNGTARITNVINKQTGAVVYDLYPMSPLRDRAGITVGASPFEYTNNGKYPRLVNIVGGTVTQILWKAPDGDQVEIAGSTSTGPRNGQFLLMPGDRLNVTYTAAPSMNYIPR